MDTFTQIALGAAVGQALGYKKIGYKAVVLGALGGLIPDLDVLYTPFLGEYGTWKYHRHITHSLFFGPTFGMIMGYISWRLYSNIPRQQFLYIAICVLALFTHPLLDLFTIYGTQLLAPISNARFEIPGVSIIDPIYTVLLLLGLLAAAIPQARRSAANIAGLCLILSTAYLFYGWHQNTKAERIARAQLEQNNISYNKISAYTTIFQPYLRRIVVWEDNFKVRVGFISTWNPGDIKWSCLTIDNDPLVSAVRESEPGQNIDWFSGGEVVAKYENNNKRLILLDARYGVPGPTIFGWWGVSFDIVQNARGEQTLSNPKKYRGMREANYHLIYQLFRAAYGLPNTFLPMDDSGCHS